jgi:hypothetical protein
MDRTMLKALARALSSAPSSESIMKIRAFGILSLLVSVAALGGCSSKTEGGTTTTASPAKRAGNAQTLGVRGKTKPAPGRTVVARPLAKKGTKTKPVSATVGASGEFELNLPRGARYVVEIIENGKPVGALRFGTGKGENMLPAPTVKGADVPELQGDVDLGDLAEASGVVTCAVDVLDLLDWDGDGVSDRDDDDDDGDGTPDAEDADDDNDGIDDDDQDFDADGDGTPDDLDDDDDGDGIPDAQDDDDDNDGVLDSADHDADDDGVADADDDDDDNDGIPDAEDQDDDNDGIPDAEEHEGAPSGNGDEEP